MQQPPVLRQDTAPAFPAHVGRYQLALPLGVGGAATVYLARSTGIGGFSREVAVKVLHPHLRLDKAYVADFLREARLAARVHHPNVLAVLDVGEDPAGVYLVMDWVDGCSLAELSQHMMQSSTPMPLPVALRIMIDALAGLHAAHEMIDEEGHPLGLVHRDVSPHNLLISAAGEIRLADFGIAKPTAQAGHTRTGVIKGKLTHMAPEQLKGAPLDRRADIWSAGVVCWELVTGKRAFRVDDEAQLIQSVAAGAIARLGTVRPELPPQLLGAIDGALAANPDDRWPTADVFRKRLQTAAPLCGGIADVDAVGAFVMSVMADVVEARREQMRASVALPALPIAPLPTPVGSGSPVRSRPLLWVGAAFVAVAATIAVAANYRKDTPVVAKPAASVPPVRAVVAPNEIPLAPPSAPQAVVQSRTQRTVVSPSRPPRAKPKVIDSAAVPPLANNPYSKP